MKFRNAAALALVGWYLMAPPTRHVNKRAYRDTDAPLSQWLLGSSWDTAKECKTELNRLRDSPIKFLAEDSLDMQCIASDDPRLRDRR